VLRIQALTVMSVYAVCLEQLIIKLCLRSTAEEGRKTGLNVSTAIFMRKETTKNAYFVQQDEQTDNIIF
jgi:hypothetical protein